MILGSSFFGATEEGGTAGEGDGGMEEADEAGEEVGVDERPAGTAGVLEGCRVLLVEGADVAKVLPLLLFSLSSRCLY